MRKSSVLAVAAALALGAPMAQASVSTAGSRSGWDPRRIFGGGKASKRARREPSRLQLRGWWEIPCDAPHGYFWHRAPAGRRLYYLLKTAPKPRIVVYDEANDRSIIKSGWGYVKPTYAHGRVA